MTFRKCFKIVKMLFRYTPILGLALGVAMGSTIALAQSGAGAIQGTVTDKTGAVIPNVAIHVVAPDTGGAYDSTSNETGFYSVPGLFAGNYNLTITAQGMQKYETSVYLHVGQTVVISPALSPATVQQQVEVSAETVQLATYDSGTISAVLENARINQLPMNGRSVLSLAGMTTPGLSTGGSRANGNEGAAMEYVQDGAALSNRNYGGPSGSLPDVDSVQEVRIETTDSNAQFAEPATAIITTKSGTNQIHGSLFETMRNNYIGIARSRANPSNFVAPHLVRNEFGGSVGGPIVLPKVYHGKDKSFWFFAYERYSLRSAPYELATVPTVAMRNGDFSGLISSAGILQTLYDPNTSKPTTYQRTTFTNNQIPISRISPLAQALYAVTPLPTTADNPLVTSNISTPNYANTTTPNITFRLDHTFNEKNNAYLRYSQTDLYTFANANSSSNAPVSLASSLLPFGAYDSAGTRSTTFSTALGYTHIFSSKLISQTVLSQEWEQEDTNLSSALGLPCEQLLGLPTNEGNKGCEKMGNTSLFMNYVGGGQSYFGGSQILSDADENLTKTVNRHQLFFGGRYRHERLGALPDRTGDYVLYNGMDTGDYNPASGANYTAAANTGNANADFFLGGADDYRQQLEPRYQHWMDQEFDTYFQDNYRVSNKVTLDFGLRWEMHPAHSEKNGLLTSFDWANTAVVSINPMSQYIAQGYTTQAIVTNLQNLGVKFETPQEAGLPSKLVYGNNFTFSPRIGIAWAPFGNGRGTVFRTGFGRYIYPIPTRFFYATTRHNVPFSVQYDQSYVAANQSPDGLPNYLLRAQQTIIAGQNSANVVNTSSINAILPGVISCAQNPRYPPNYVTQWNTTIEQPLKPDAVFRVSYIWDEGTNLDQWNYINNPMSTYVWELTTGTTPPTGTYSTTALGPYNNTIWGANYRDDRYGWSNDNSLIANYQHLYRHGYAFQVFYVYSRAFRMGGNSTSDSVIYPAGDYAPGTAPSANSDIPYYSNALNYFQNHILDSAIPEHRISANGIFDLPIGRGKRFLSNVNRLTDELIGGYQIAGDVNILSQYFQPSTSNWGPTNPIQTYKKKYSVTDCSSGVCRPGYYWFNGYNSPKVMPSPLGTCTSNCITGLPSNYAPYQTPIDMSPTPAANYLTNNVSVPLNNGTSVTVAYSPGPSGVNPFSHTFLHGPFNYSPDLSIFKVFPITERSFFRINVDAFNALNIQGYTNPNTTNGLQEFTSSYNTPRQVQISARLTF